MHAFTRPFKIAVFANFFIDNEERFQRMQDSFQSFCGLRPDFWLVAVRGGLKQETKTFLEENIKEKAEVVLLPDKSNWLNESLKLSNKLDCDLVFFWVEDHKLISSVDKFNEVLNEVWRHGIEQLFYSWYQENVRAPYFCIDKTFSLNTIDAWKITKKERQLISKLIGDDFYVISMISVFKTEMFRQILSSKRPVLRRWPKHLPFDFEKKNTDHAISSVLTALPKQELFVSIDDDHGEEGYSLISRGLYPARVSRDKILEMEERKKVHPIYTFIEANFPARIVRWLKQARIFVLRLTYTFP